MKKDQHNPNNKTLIKALFSTVIELFAFLWKTKLWWMIPIVGLLLLLSSFMVITEYSAVSPMIYTIF